MDGRQRTPIANVEYLRYRLHYDPVTGEWRWRTRIEDNRNHAAWNARYAGRLTATVLDEDGYRVLSLDGYNYKAHRLAWFYMTGAWPVNQIDHRDLDRANCKWENLRDATQEGNQQNRLVTRRSKSGIKGVTKHKDYDLWKAEITAHGRIYYLGWFKDPTVAAAVYNEAAQRLHGEFARTS
jgi:hypothetical protein